jgi:hypothetical protein
MQKFTVTPTALLFASAVSVQARLLYVVLSSYGQGGTGTVYPKQETLARALGCSDRSIQRYIQELCDCGVIVAHRTRKGNGELGRNRYQLLGFEVEVEVEVDDETDHTTPVSPGPPDTRVAHHTTPVSGREQYQPNNTNQGDTTRARGQLALAPPIEPEQEPEPPKRSRFQKPTAEQLAAELAKRGMPQAVAEQKAGEFIDHYESNGWKVGKTPMKSWKAACGTWVRNWQQNQQKRGLGHGGRAFQQTTREDADRRNREAWGGDAPEW